MIEHRHASRNGGRMSVRHVGRAGTQLDLFGGGCDPCDERNAGSDILGSIGDVFADVAFSEAQFVG
jgi:hypothetical protein